MDAPELWFDHEKLESYREAVAFVGWLAPLMEGAVRVGEVKDQLDRASTSIPLNIPRVMANTRSKIAAVFSISRTAPRSNVPPLSMFSLPGES